MLKSDDRVRAAIAATRSVMLPEVCLTEDLAASLRISLSAVRALLRSGQIPGRKLGRRWVVDRSSFLNSLRSETSRSPSISLVD